MIKELLIIAAPCIMIGVGLCWAIDLSNED